MGQKVYYCRIGAKKIVKNGQVLQERCFLVTVKLWDCKVAQLHIVNSLRSTKKYQKNCAKRIITLKSISYLPPLTIALFKVFLKVKKWKMKTSKKNFLKKFI